MIKSKVFLTGRWSNLVMINYVVDPVILKPLLPKYTELDIWNGKCYLSLVGFLFEDTRLKGIKIPCHTTFEEVNLRFYVKHFDGNDWKRGVVFIKEIVPKPALTFVANTFFKEHYATLPMKHDWNFSEDSIEIKYSWKTEFWNSFLVNVSTNSKQIEFGSNEEFITEHYWGYTKIDESITSEYQVEHPRWEIYETHDYTINVNFESTYGKEFAFLQDLSPESVFVARGSEITVRSGKRISPLYL